MAELTPKELKDMLDKLDAVCKQAQELQKAVREKMAESRRRDRQDRSGQPERRNSIRRK